MHMHLDGRKCADVEKKGTFPHHNTKFRMDLCFQTEKKVEVHVPATIPHCPITKIFYWQGKFNSYINLWSLSFIANRFYAI